MINKLILFIDYINTILRIRACRDLIKREKRTFLESLFVKVIVMPLWELGEKAERILINFFTDEEIFCNVDECQNITTVKYWEEGGWIELFSCGGKTGLFYSIGVYICSDCKNKKIIIDFYSQGKYKISITVDEMDDKTTGEIVGICKRGNESYKIRQVT